MEHCEVVVIGLGAMGAATTYQLAKAGSGLPRPAGIDPKRSLAQGRNGPKSCEAVLGQKRPLIIYEIRAHSVAVARKSVLVIRKSRRQQLRNSQSQRRTSAL